jgi:acyl-phosphate glycerol 3-phosphate acyltransferase
MPVPALFGFAAYLLGSIPVGFLLARRYGVDIRTAGSGNIGATNVYRVLGKRLGVVVFVLDFLKGAVPVVVAQWLDVYPPLPVFAGLAAILGHMCPVWLNFRGGKGVATGAGVVAVLLPVPTAGALLVWLAFFSATRIVSLSSLVAAAALVGFRLLFTSNPFGPEQSMLTGFCWLAAVLVFLRHRSNLSRLLRGTEPPIAEHPAMSLLSRVIHVLALSLWFGGGVFFTFVVAPSLFGTLEGLGEKPPEERPGWLPLPSNYDKAAGTRLAGETISPMFPRFFAMQGMCGILALITALGFTRAEPARCVHRVRFWLVALAVLTLLAAWPLNQHVSELRQRRNDGDPAAKAAFGGWHAASLLLNFGTLGLVTGAMATAAALPPGPGRSAASDVPKSA